MRVMTLGTFDILHYGHLALLKFCKQLAGQDDFIVGLNTSAFVKEYKGHYPIMDYEERKKTLLSLPWIDAVVKNRQPKEPATAVMAENGIKIVVVGMDWYEGILKQWGTNREWLDKSGICICYFPHFKTQTISSTVIKERIRKSQ